jgi:hypothetical protein
MVELTVMNAVPDFELSCVEVAVTVTTSVVLTTGAVNTPAEVMVPAVALNVTPVLKVPVPSTAASHWLVPPEGTELGVQLRVTEVMLETGLLLPPPPQAAIVITLTTTSNNPSVRTGDLL